MTTPHRRLKAQEDLTSRHVTREEAEQQSLADRAATGMQAAVTALRDNPATGTLAVAAVTSAVPVVAAVRSRSSSLATWAKRAIVWGSAGVAAAATAAAWRVAQSGNSRSAGNSRSENQATAPVERDLIADLYGRDWLEARAAVATIADRITGGVDSGQAQGWLDVLCDYLRSPSAKTLDGTSSTEAKTKQAIVGLIADNLRRETDYAWSDLNFNFAGSHLPEIDFRGTHFRGPVTFARATFTAVALFDKARFDCGVSFENATFSDQLSFGSALCGQFFNFQDVSCSREAWFDVVTMESDADFSDSTFGARVLFSDAVFDAPVHFERVTFAESAWYDRVSFIQGGSFNGSSFFGEVDFTCARADVQPTFNGAVMRAGLLSEEGNVHVPAEIVTSAVQDEVVVLPVDQKCNEVDTKHVKPHQ